VAGLSRKELKKDKVAEVGGDIFEWTAEHKGEVLRYGALAIVVLIAAVGFNMYRSHAASSREEALAQALKVDDATVGSNAQAANLHYNTQEEKDKARSKAFGEVAKDPGTLEGAIAGFYLAGDAVDKGDLAQAEKRYKEIADSAPAAFSSQARLSLARVYAAEGKMPEAQKEVQYLIDHPTITVSKESATITMAEILAKSNPAQARKLLEPLRTSRGPVSRSAITALSEVPAQGQ